MTAERLIPPSLVFRLDIGCHATKHKWDDKVGLSLDARHVLPDFSVLDDRTTFADVKAAWSQEGLFFEVSVRGKSQSLWCRETQLTESDGFQVWIDTRNTHNIHRASRFCHWFLFLPSGGGSNREKPIATMLRINRAKEDPKCLNQVKPRVQASRHVNGYRLSVHIPQHSLSGWNPSDHRKIGFNYLILDREFGSQTLSIGLPFPISEDPSLWQTLSLLE